MPKGSLMLDAKMENKYPKTEKNISTKIIILAFVKNLAINANKSLVTKSVGRNHKILLNIMSPLLLFA